MRSNDALDIYRSEQIDPRDVLQAFMTCKTASIEVDYRRLGDMEIVT